MDTGAKLGEVWGKQPVADEICNFLFFSMVLFKQNQSCKRFDLHSEIYIFYTPKQLSEMKCKDTEKRKVEHTQQFR